MGILFSCCRRNKGAEYEPLKEGEDQIAAIEKSKLQALEDEDNELLKDPTIQEVLNDSGSDQPQMDDDEMEDYIKSLTA